MTNIIKSLIIVIAVAAIAGGATYAGVFSAQDNIPGNTVSTATVVFDAHNFSGNKPIGTIPVVGGLVPGQFTSDGRAELYNKSEVPVKIYMYVTGLNGDACGKTNLEVKTGFAGGNETERTVLYNALTNIDSPAERVEVTGNPPFVTAGPNITQVIHQRAQLDSSADDSYQGKTCKWDEIFVAETVAL
jgi:hypothetical protein